MPRSSHILTLLFYLTWVFIILPLHTRGAIPIGGCPDCDSTPLFLSSVDHPCCKDKSSPQHSPKKSSSNCALCQLATHTPSVPAIPPLTLTLRLAELLPPPIPEQAVHQLLLTSTRSRAPPSEFTL